MAPGTAYNFEDCKNSCQNSNQCKVRILLNSQSLASHCENFLYFYLFQYFSWVQARLFCGRYGSEGTWDYISGIDTGIKTGMFAFTSKDYVGSWDNYVRSYKSSSENSEEACLSKCKADSQCKSLNFVNGKCLLNNFDGGYWTKVPGVVNAEKSDC